MNTVRTIKLCVAICCYLLFCGCATTAPKTQITSGPQAKIALVLGAGAAKGFAHIGVLKILESSKIPLHMIVGTSVGSFVGSLYAYGYDAYALQKIAMTLQKSDVAELTIPDNGFLKGERLRDYVNTKVHSATLDKLKIPMYVVATDIKTGNSVVFNSGNTGMAVQASCSIPGVFQPARFSGASYVDGGVVNPLAVDVARRFGADIVIAVDVSSAVTPFDNKFGLDVVLRADAVTRIYLNDILVTEADVVIQPVVGFVGSADFAQRNEAIMEGEKAALAVMPQINAILAKLRQEGRLP